MDKSKWSGTPGPPEIQITRRTFVRTSAAAAVGVAAGLDALRAAAPADQTGPPPLAFDETQESELLVNPRDILTSRWRDGDVIQVYSTYDSLRVHAETIASGRGLYRGEAVPDLRDLYDAISNRRRLVPDRADLLWWWDQAETLAGLDRNDFMRYPFTALERRIFLVLPMEVDLTPALRQRWHEGDKLKQFKLSVNWRQAVVDTRLAAAADEVVFTIGAARGTGTINGLSGTGPWRVFFTDSTDLTPYAPGDFYEDPTGGLYNITNVSSGLGSANYIDVGMDFSTSTPSSSGTATLGRAFGTIAAWEAGMAAYLNLNDTTVGEIYNDALIQESPVTITDNTVGSQGQLIIRVPDSERHAGLAGTGARWQQTSSGSGIRLNISSSTPAMQIIDGLEIIGVSVGQGAGVWVSASAGAGKTVIRNLIVHGYTAGAQGSALGLFADADGVDFINCLVYWIREVSPAAAYGITIGTDAGNVRILNCTIDQCYDYAIRSAHDSGLVAPRVQNCGGFNANSAAFSSVNGWHTSSNYNADDDGTAPGPNSITTSASAEFVSVTQGSEDYHLKSTATSVDAGTDLSSLFTL